MNNFLRAGVRIPVQLPAQLRWKDRAGKVRQALGETATISGNGLFVTAPVRLQPETPVIITVALPAEMTPVPIELYCQGRSVRQKLPRNIFGVGAIIDDYQFRPAHRPV